MQYFLYVPFLTMIPISRHVGKSVPEMKAFQYNIFLIFLQMDDKSLWDNTVIIRWVNLPPLFFGRKSTFILKAATYIYYVILGLYLSKIKRGWYLMYIRYVFVNQNKIKYQR